MKKLLIIFAVYGSQAVVWVMKPFDEPFMTLSFFILLYMPLLINIRVYHGDRHEKQWGSYLSSLTSLTVLMGRDILDYYAYLILSCTLMGLCFFFALKHFVKPSKKARSEIIYYRRDVIYYVYSLIFMIALLSTMHPLNLRIVFATGYLMRLFQLFNEVNPHPFQRKKVTIIIGLLALIVGPFIRPEFYFNANVSPLLAAFIIYYLVNRIRKYS